MNHVLAAQKSIKSVMASYDVVASAAWYLAGGVSLANCTAAYQSKGAASLAASYTNLANPGVYTITPGNAPTWDTVSGWIFARASQQSLETGIQPPTYQCSVIVRFSDIVDVADMSLIAMYNSPGRTLIISPGGGAQNRRYFNGTLAYLDVSPKVTAGVMAIAGKNAYYNGTAETGIIPAGDQAGGSVTLRIGRYLPSVGYLSGKVQAVAIYNTILTGSQILAISTAMAAL